MYAADKGTLDFWEHAGKVVISLDALKQHFCDAREFATRIERNKQESI